MELGVVALGFADSGFSWPDPPSRSSSTGLAWLTGGSFGIEGGVVGIVFLVTMTALMPLAARGTYGPWTVRPGPEGTSER